MAVETAMERAKKCRMRIVGRVVLPTHVRERKWVGTIEAEQPRTLQQYLVIGLREFAQRGALEGADRIEITVTLAGAGRRANRKGERYGGAETAKLEPPAVAPGEGAVETVDWLRIVAYQYGEAAANYEARATPLTKSFLDLAISDLLKAAADHYQKQWHPGSEAAEQRSGRRNAPDQRPRQ